MKKLLKELDAIDFESVVKTKRILTGLNGDILFFGKRNNKNMLLELKHIVDDFISINSKGVYKSYRQQRFLGDMGNLVLLITKFLEG